MFTFKTYLAVMAGGALGTGLRLCLSGLLAAKYGDTFPIGTLVVNVLGSFVIGIYTALTGPEGTILATPLSRQFITIGVIGGFTTFSSFSLQTLNLAAGGEWLRGALNVLLSVALCLLGVWAGNALGAGINQR